MSDAQKTVAEDRPGTWAVIREPDDRLADVRVSVGSKGKLGAYAVFRGDPDAAAELLRAAADALADAKQAGTIEDKRGRPQG